MLSSSSHRSGRASHAARELGTGEDVVAYQARAAVRQKRACPDDAPRRARVPEAKAPAGAEPATGAVPPLRAAGTADAARPAPPTQPTPPTRAALAIAPPVNPGCPTRLLARSPANWSRRWCRPGDGGIPKAASQGLHPHRTTAWHVLPAYPRSCHYEGDRRTRRETLQSARCAPASRHKMYRMCRRPLASFSKMYRRRLADVQKAFSRCAEGL